MNIVTKCRFSNPWRRDLWYFFHGNDSSVHGGGTCWGLRSLQRGWRNMSDVSGVLFLLIIKPLASFF